MGNLVMGQDLGARLLDILGLPKTTRSITINMAIGDPVTVSCEYYPEMPDGGMALEMVLKQYQLAKKPEDGACAPERTAIVIDFGGSGRDMAAAEELICAALEDAISSAEVVVPRKPLEGQDDALR